MVFNATFNNISVISWRSVLLVEKTTDLAQITDKLDHIMSYWVHLTLPIITHIMMRTIVTVHMSQHTELPSASSCRVYSHAHCYIINKSMTDDKLCEHIFAIIPPATVVNLYLWLDMWIRSKPPCNILF